MKRNVLWLLSTITGVVLLFGYHTSTSGALSTSGTVLSSSAPPGRASAASGQGGSGSGGGNGGNQAKGTGNGGNGAGDSGGNTSGTAGSGTATTQPTTRTVTGGVAQTQWGPVQVQLTLKGSTITHVTLLQYPSGNPQDDQINSYALPILIQNTLNAQSAQIDMVSGATVTSTGYVQSLQSALDQAGL
jgi:uncharacterized protein with FMN-binding domain